MRFFALVAFVLCSGLRSGRADLPEAVEAAKAFEVSSGLKVEAVAAEPVVKNPVAISMDEKGRFWVAETYRLDNAVVDITKNTNWIKADLSFRNFRDRVTFLTNVFGTNADVLTRASERLNMLADLDHNGIYETNRPSQATFREVESGLAAGVLAHNGKVYFACIPNLWVFDFQNPASPIIRTLASGFGVHIGVTGHDLHGLTIGMDGKLYFSMGDRGFSIQSTKGIRTIIDTGAILRCNLDGTEMEVAATGLRNPQDLTFDALGNLWTADNDTAGEDKSRLIHVVEGADYGWRCSYQHMKGFGPWVQEKLWEGKLDGTLPTCGEPAQGPAGLAYYPGTGLPAEFAGRFLLCDFPGGIQSFTVEPKGASYVIKDKKHFLWNAWPTDIEFGTDGLMYFSDWVSGWSLPYKGRIYRVTHPDVMKDPKTIDTANILKAGFEARATTNLLALLEHHDLRVRQGAHLALARRKSESGAALREIATDATKTRFTRLHAIWALRMQGTIEPPIVEKLLADKDLEIRAQSVASAPSSGMLKMFGDESPRVRFYAAAAYQTKLLFDSNNSLAVQAILDLLEKNNDEDPYLTHAGVRLLQYSSPALQRAKRHASVAVRRAALLAERLVGSPTISNSLKDPDLAYEAARAINDGPIGAAFPQLAAMLTNNCPTNILSRAINVNFRIGGALPAKRLANFAATATNAPLAARLNALDCLAQWQEPDELDRVVGLYRPIAPNVNTRPGALALAALEPHWTNLFAEANESVALAALTCVRELSATNELPQVLALFNSPARPAKVRAAALDTLRELDDTNFVAAIDAALADKDLRVPALKVIPTNAPAATVKRVVELAATATDVPTIQSALAAVARMEPPGAVESLRALLQRVSAKQTPPEVNLDVLETARHYPALKSEADAAATKGMTDPSTEPLLVGGDAAEGRKVFKERADVSCMRCHVAEGVGGTVGPSLDGNAGKLTRTYILESILQPNKVIAPGYDNIVVVLQNGRQFSGAFVRETGATLQMNSPEDGILTFRKNDISRAVHAQSAMPEGLGQLLGPYDLRNLVEYIATLK